jgi:hypothetical protein
MSLMSLFPISARSRTDSLVLHSSKRVGLPPRKGKPATASQRPGIFLEEEIRTLHRFYQPVQAWPKKTTTSQNSILLCGGKLVLLNQAENSCLG